MGLLFFSLRRGRPQRALAAGWLLALGLLALGPARPAAAAAGPTPAQARCFRLLHAGDSVYARKAGYNSFVQSLTYYERARALADSSQDPLLLAEAVFAKGRIYDAWNKEPQKTITYFQQATALFRRLPGPRSYIRYLYAKHLVAHAYDKVPDSLHAVQVLRQLRRELATAPDTLLRRLPFTVEMALIATEVKNYALADTLLRQLSRRAWIANDPDTYNYLDHYYLVQSRLDVYFRRRPRAPYLDSLQAVGRRLTNAVDRQYYAQNLARLSVAAGRPQAAYDYLVLAARLRDSLNNNGDASTLRQALVGSETRAAARQQQYQAAARAGRTRTLWLLLASLGSVSLLSFYLARQVRISQEKTKTLTATNHALDAEVGQVELLNKEMQHRVKNNLHMIFSLLQMQERRTDNAEVIEQLQAARLRVESIAALHHQLLDPAAGLDLGAYLTTIVSAAVGCLATAEPVRTHLAVQALHLPPNRALALALVINEWVTNSVKYAHPAGGPLEISVRTHPHPTAVQFEYADNGAPAAGGAAAAGGLGTQIVALLCRQLGATLATPPRQPYHYTLLVPLASV